ncbi:hypothetical protein RND81_14G141600 [Saponaria officinalis]|uniref:Uncharacterized protein n=1 Tax=Saponaria officinalis TaxID=3572 RepID=A0AAW1GM00_SAPOF
MTTMDIKGVSWVGNMCQRFEALCVDIDEAIYEDTFIYVGNQMRTVGKSVKKFYSEVVQDLLSSSSLDSAKGKDALNTVEHNGGATACKKQKLVSERKSVDTASVKTGNSLDGDATVKSSVSCGPCSSAEELSTPVKLESQSADMVSNQSPTVESYINRGEEQEAQLKSFFVLSGKDSVEEFTCNESRNERDDVLCGCGDIGSVKASAAFVCESNKDKVKISWDIMEENASALAVEGTQTEGTCTELNNPDSSIEAALDTTKIDNVQDAVEVDALLSVSNAGTYNCTFFLISTCRDL